MPETRFPPVAEVLPQAGNMVLLSRILEHGENETVCAVEIDDQALFRDEDGGIAAWIGLELMAQCIAARSGLVGRSEGGGPRVGFLLGARRVQFHSPRYHAGQSLQVRARQTWGKAVGMVAFDCCIEDGSSGQILAEGRLNCFLPEEGAGLEGLQS